MRTGKVQKTQTSIIDEARTLAHCHKRIDPGTICIICYSKQNDCTIKLLEVSKDVPVSGSVFAVNFAPGNGVSHPSSIILLNPRDFKKVMDGKLSLPDDWGDVDTGDTLLGKAI